jgi:hypothetical protein
MERFSQNNSKIEHIFSKENEIEKSQIKEGLDFVYEQNQELSTIGTKEEYSKYLDTIFPDSNMKEIFYHGSEESFERFEKKSEENLSPLGYFFSDNLDIAAAYSNPIKKNIRIRYQALEQENKEYEKDFSLGQMNNLTEALDAYDNFDKYIENNYQKIFGRYTKKDSFKVLEIEKPEKKGLYSVVLNIKSPLYIEFNSEKINQEKSEGFEVINSKNYERENVFNAVKKYPTADSVILDNVYDIRTFRKEGDDEFFIQQKQIVVFDSDQIHILGSDDDLEKFRTFVETQN